METLKLTLAPRADAPSQARRAIRVPCSELTDGLRARLELVVSELVSNAVQHGALAEHAPIELRLTIEESRCRVEVDDPGLGFGSGERRPSPGVEAERGRGLFLVARLSSRWGVDRVRQKTRVWAELA